MKKTKIVLVIFLSIFSLFFIYILNFKFYKKTISKEELNNITNYLNHDLNNGFINHTYNTSNDIKLSEVLYNNTSVGTIVPKDSEEYKFIVKELYNGLPPIGDIIKFNLLDIKILYFEKTGLDISENNEQINLKYYSNYLEENTNIYQNGTAIYCQNYSDTHYLKVNCISGFIDKNNFYHIKYELVEDTSKNYEVTLRKTGNNYVFIQNKEVI